MAQSSPRLHDPGCSAQVLGSIERKLKDEIRVGQYLDATISKPGREFFQLDEASRLTNYVRTIDSNVSRAFLYRHWRRVGLLYHNHSNGSILLLEMNYF